MLKSWPFLAVIVINKRATVENPHKPERAGLICLSFRGGPSIIRQSARRQRGTAMNRGTYLSCAVLAQRGRRLAGYVGLIKLSLSLSLSASPRLCFFCFVSFLWRSVGWLIPPPLTPDLLIPCQLQRGGLQAVKLCVCVTDRKRTDSARIRRRVQCVPVLFVAISDVQRFADGWHLVGDFLSSSVAGKP